MGRGMFSYEGKETYNPEYGDVYWKQRLNNWLEEQDMTLRPVFYHEDGRLKMQVTQENTAIVLNVFVDEMDCIVVNYTEDRIPDEADLGTYYWREAIGDERFKKIQQMIGAWAVTSISLYPDEDLVEIYEELHKAPDDLSELDKE